MTRESTIRRAVLLTLIGAAATATAAEAQQVAAEEPAVLTEVIVTGSRIARSDLESASPLVVVNEEFFKQKGSVNVEEVLNQLPQIVPGLGAQVNNGGDGTATVDLRGIGPTRTLVLINGRRFVPATQTGRTDLNAIPANLIRRIDVVTGGASAVYGSDALAGVVNFILKDDFEGIELGTRFGQSGQGDGTTRDLYLLLGGNFADGRGNAVIAASAYDRDDVLQSEREWSAIDLQGNGSATGIAGRLDNSPFNPYQAFGGAPAGSNYAFNADGSVRRFDNNLPELNNGVGDRYNFAPVNYLVTPQQRYTLDGFLKYDLTSSLQAYAELYYISNKAAQNLAPTPATNLVLPITNPLLSASARALLAARPDPTAPAIFRRRMVEFGPRVSDVKFDTSQVVTGLKGELGGDWSWDAYYSYGRTAQTIGILGDISETRLNASLAGCPAGAGTVPGCRIVDFFGPDKITAADASWLRISSAVDTFEFQRHLFQAIASGPLFQLPAGAVGSAVGVEYRDDQTEFVPSDSSQRGDLSGFNAVQPVSGGFDVKEFYAEIEVPLVADASFARSLSFDAAARLSDYSTVGNLFTYKGGLEWKPIDSLRFRTTYAKAIRAPSVFELFQAGDQSFPTVTDPCALIRANGTPQTPTPATLAVCQLSGLPGAGTLPAQTNSQVEARLTGNPDLEEEEGDTFTVGLVWQPTSLDGFSATLDYYDITVSGYVARLSGGAAAQVAACFFSGITTAAQYAADPNCANISRNPSGELLITQPRVNTGDLKTNGVDVALNYSFDFGGANADAGRLSVRLDANFLNSWELGGVEYAGQTSSDNGTLPELRTNMRVVYDIGAFQASLNWQRVGEVEERPGDGGDTDIPAYDYFDLFARYTLAERYELSLGVSNLTDKDPPIILTGFTNTNTDNSQYDGLGRKYVLSFIARF